VLKNYRFDEGMKYIWEEIAKTNNLIDEKKPWKLTGEELERTMEPIAAEVVKIGYLLRPFLPETAEKIIKQFSGNKIISVSSLFPRIQ
jgi:methionyl-tRNA synthetase